MYWLCKFIRFINVLYDSRYKKEIHKHCYTFIYDHIHDIYHIEKDMNVISCMLTKDKSHGYRVQNMQIKTPEYTYYYTYSTYPSSGITLHGIPYYNLKITWRVEYCKKYKEPPIASHKKQRVTWYRYGKKIYNIETPYIELSRRPDGTTNITKKYNWDTDQGSIKIGHDEIRSHEF